MSLINIIARFSNQGLSNSAGGTTPPPDPEPSGDNTKNVRVVPASAAANNKYMAFGTLLKTGSNRMTYITRVGQIPPGTYAHLEGGRTFQFHYTIDTDTWDSGTLIDSESGRDMSDCNGGEMDNGKYVYFSSVGPDLENEIDAVIFFRIANDSNLNWGARKNLLTDVGAIDAPASTLSGTCFGAMQKGDAPGEYYIAYVQFYSAAGKKYCVKTTDYWETWTFYEIFGDPVFNETALVYLGSNRLVSISRRDGFPVMYKSSDGGETWDYLNTPPNLNYGYQPIIPHFFVDDGLLFLIYQDRDSGFIKISKDNDPDDFFSTGAFNEPELYHYTFNGESSGNPSLGYPSIRKMFSGGYLIVFAKEVSSNDADLWYSRDDLNTDPNGVPIAIPSTAVGSNSNSAYVGMGGYTLAQMDNIRYFEVDVSTASDFSTFATVKYRHPSLEATLMHDARLTGLTLNLEGLPSATTYYIRIRACNNAGKSGYIQKTVTTT